MEMPVVDNEFLDLFLPEASEVNSNDIIEEFKFYIFRIMNLTIEDLIQEQVTILSIMRDYQLYLVFAFYKFT